MASLRKNVKQLKNVGDARQVFTQLLKKKDIPEALALECDKPLLPVLKDALALLNKGNLSLPLQLLAALSQEKLSHGIYAELVLDTFNAYYEAPGFMEAMKADLQKNSLEDPAALAWMLMKLGAEKEGVRQCKNEVVNDIVEILLQSKAPGMEPIAPQLATVFAKVNAPTPGDDSRLILITTAVAPESLQTAKHAMRPLVSATTTTTTRTSAPSAFFLRQGKSAAWRARTCRPWRAPASSGTAKQPCWTASSA